ncbi:unnamed protein product [Ilex paraguariensis]|uniref:Uncharacterized protein n=1 Tax=Ilex paraguariensis TaxID=185542 RepID=A0ABC8UNR9_9AQUA
MVGNRASCDPADVNDSKSSDVPGRKASNFSHLGRIDPGLGLDRRGLVESKSFTSSPNLKKKIGPHSCCL